MEQKTHVAIAPWTQTWPSSAAWAGTSPGPQVEVQATLIRLFLTTLTFPVPFPS